MSSSSTTVQAVGSWKATILATTTEGQDTKKPFTLYVLSVHYTIPPELRTDASAPSVIDWTVSHRYSDFEALRSHLAEFSKEVPVLPGKSWFGSLKQDLIQQRKYGLNAFLAECLGKPWILELSEWKDFLGVTKNVKPAYLYQWRPVEIKAVRNASITGSQTESYGVNDLIYRPKELVLILGMEEQRLMQKVDNIMSGIRMPWEKEKPIRPMPLGCIKIHRVDETGSWKTMCALSTPAGVVCVAFHPDTRTLIAGMDDGTIVLYRVNPAYVEIEEKKQLHVHEKQRVTQVYFHQRSQLILSTARDKTFCIYDLRKDLTLSSTLVGSAVGAAAWVSAMEVDEEADRVFLGTYAQFIHIYDISSPTAPKLLHTLEGHTGSVRCLQYRPNERYLFSGGFDAVAGIWSIPGGNSNEAVLRTRSVGWLKDGANEKIKSIVFIPPSKGTIGDSGQGLVVCGTDGGYICIFNVATGRMKYVMKAHVNSVVKLVYLPEANVVISAGLDGVVKFWSIPLKATSAGEDGPNTVISLEDATQSLSLGGGSSVSTSRSVSSPTAAVDASGRRKSSSLTSPQAPPPTMQSTNSVLHKGSRADSTDGVTLFSHSYADNTVVVKNTRTSFFQDDDDDSTTIPSRTTSSKQPSSASSSSLFNEPSTTATKPTTTTTTSSSTIDSDPTSQDAIEVPVAATPTTKPSLIEEEEPDMF